MTTAEDGSVTVHLDEDHPGFGDPEYRAAAQPHRARWRWSWEPGRADPPRRLHRARSRRSGGRSAGSWPPSTSGSPAPSTARRWRSLALPTDHIPQLDEVSARLRPLTGFEYHPAAGLVPFDEFYGSLADGVFHSTQYIRHHARPLYTPEPDLIHEVIGHGGHAGQPPAGRAQPAGRAAPPGGWRPRPAATSSPACSGSRSSSACSARHGELRAYGAGLLSSYGEIEEFRGAEIRPLDVAEMGTLDYDITQYQPILFAADGIEQLLEVVGGFFAELRRRLAGPAAPATRSGASAAVANPRSSTPSRAARAAAARSPDRRRQHQPEGEPELARRSPCARRATTPRRRRPAR